MRRMKMEIKINFYTEEGEINERNFPDIRRAIYIAEELKEEYMFPVPISLKEIPKSFHLGNICIHDTENIVAYRKQKYKKKKLK